MNFKYIAVDLSSNRSWNWTPPRSPKNEKEFANSMYSDLWKQGHDGGDEGFYRDYGNWQVYEAIGFELRHCGSVLSILKAQNEPN